MKTPAPSSTPRLLSIRAVAPILLAAATSSAPASDWPHWRGPQGNGISTESGWRTDWPANGPRVLWKADVGLGFSSVTVADGRAYTQGHNASAKQDTIFCLDAATGEARWRHTYAHPHDKPYYQGGTSGTPTVADGRVYTVSKRGHVLCLDAATGAVVWRKHLTDDFGAKMPTWGFASSVLIDGDRAVLNAGIHGIALDRKTGNAIWKSGTAECGYATPVPFEQAGRKRYLIFAAKALVAVDAADGRAAWSQKWETEYDVNAADPVVVSADRIFVSSGYERGGALLDVSGETPKILWENKNVRSMLNAGVKLGDHLYAIDGNTGGAQLRCLDLATGSPAWTFKDPNHGALSVADGKLIVIGEKGELFVGEANPQGFKPLARAQVGGGTYWTVPVLANGRLYVRSGEGRLACLDMSGK